MTTLDLIKMLPMDEKVRAQLLSKYPQLDPSQKLDVDRMAWTTYDAMREATIEENLGIQYEKVKKGEEKFGDGFYERALKKTNQELAAEMQKNSSDFDLSEARKAMEIIVREIYASKNHKLKKHLN